MSAVLLAPGDRDGLCVRIDRVFDEFRDCLQRVRLREGNDPDRIPVIAYLQLTA